MDESFTGCFRTAWSQVAFKTGTGSVLISVDQWIPGTAQQVPSGTVSPLVFVYLHEPGRGQRPSFTWWPREPALVLASPRTFPGLRFRSASAACWLQAVPCPVTKAFIGSG